MQPKTLSFLFDAGQALNRTLDLHTIFNTLYEQLVQVLPCDMLIVSRYDAETQMIHCMYNRNEAGELDVSAFPPIPLEPEGQGTQSRVIHSGQSLWLPNYESSRRTASTRYFISPKGEMVTRVPKGAKRPRSVLMAPLLLDEQVIGVIQVFSYRKGAHRASHLRLLENLALHVVNAMSNAQQYQRAQRELEERRKAEANVRAMLLEKEVLLREVHHRVKNNLQSMISLISLRIDEVVDEPTRDFLESLQQQARTMALVYDQFSRVENLAGVEMCTYLKQIAANVRSSYVNQVDAEITVETFMQPGLPGPLQMDVSMATPTGLMVNELVTNALKYAFPLPRESQAQVKIALSANDGCFHLMVADNGIGLPPDFDMRTHASLGLYLVRLWVTHQLGGQIHILPGQGAHFEIEFPRNHNEII